MDRRALFFLAAAVVSMALAPATEAKHRWVPEWLAVLYVVLAVLSLLDSWSRHRPPPRTRPRDATAQRAREDLTRTGR